MGTELLPEPIRSYMAFVSVVAVGLAALFAWMDRRDKAIEARVEARMKAAYGDQIKRQGESITDLTRRLDAVEKAQEEAMGYVADALDLAAAIPNTADLRALLRKAIQALA